MLKRIVVLVLLAGLSIIAVRHAGSFLVINTAEHADLIVVLDGGDNDLRYWSGVRLLQQGWAPRLMQDVFSKEERFGNWNTDLAREFLNRTTPGQSTVCPIAENSTYDEARYLEQCLRSSNVKSILIVTSEYHTRRALSILQTRLPQYHFSVYAAPDPYNFGHRWWQKRQWAKTTHSEWQRYLWWLFIDRWRSGLVVH